MKYSTPYKIYMILRCIRLEYYPGYYLYGIAMLLTPTYRLPSLAQITHVILILSFAGAYAMMLNILSDRETDRKISHKQFMAITVDIVGECNIKVLSIIFAVTLITVHMMGVLVANTIKDIMVSTLMLAVGMILAYVYSVKPFRTKSRPFLDLITLYILIFVTQTLYILSIQTMISEFEINLTLSLSLLWLASTVIPSQVEDAPFDRLAGVTTFASTYSSKVVIPLMLVLTLIGGMTSYLSLARLSNAPLLLLFGLIVIPLTLEAILSLCFLLSKNYSYFRYSSAIEWFVSNASLLLNNILSLSR